MGWRSKEGYYLFFRRSCLKLQERFSRLMPVSQMPRVFLHGNPHIDNFAKTPKGEGMIDFDRSRIGPYAWDLVRFLSSLSLRREEPTRKFLSNRVLREFFEAYIDAFSNPWTEFEGPTVIKLKPEAWQKSTDAYLRKGLGWSKKLKSSSLPPNHHLVQTFLRLYAASRREPALVDDYRVSEAGVGLGSLGKPRLLVALAPKDKKKDKILLDLKEVYSDADTRHFFNPFIHHGLRMIEASHLYAPGLETRLGYFTWKGKQFWGRQVPCFKAKLKGDLTESRQLDLAIVVGLQLGRAHRRSLRDGSPKEMMRHLKTHTDEFVRVGESLNQQLHAAWTYHYRFQDNATPTADPTSVRPSQILQRISRV